MDIDTRTWTDISDIEKAGRIIGLLMLALFLFAVLIMFNHVSDGALLSFSFAFGFLTIPVVFALVYLIVRSQRGEKK